MAAIDDVLITHSHLDHIAALPLMLDAIASRRTRPLRGVRKRRRPLHRLGGRIK